MVNVSKWSNVAISMQSAIDAPQTITAITNANPGVASVAAHGYSDGDYVLLSVVGMTELNGRVVRINNSTAGDFELEGFDTTTMGAFTSGTVQKLTLGTSFSTVTGLTGSGGEFDFITTTTVHINIQTQIPGSASALTYSFENLWDVADPGLIAMNLASDQQSERAFIFTFSNGQIMVFNGFVGASLVPTGTAQDKVVTSTTVTAFGLPTYYAS